MLTRWTRSVIAMSVRRHGDPTLSCLESSPCSSTSPDLPQTRAEAAEAETSRLDDEIDDLERRLNAAEAAADAARTDLDAARAAEQATQGELQAAQAELHNLAGELESARAAAAEAAAEAANGISQVDNQCGLPAYVSDDGSPLAHVSVSTRKRATALARHHPFCSRNHR